jgi:hypothetical protein
MRMDGWMDGWMEVWNREMEHETMRSIEPWRWYVL